MIPKTDRRSFIKQSALTGTAAWLTEQVLPSSDTLERREVTSSVDPFSASIVPRIRIGVAFCAMAEAPVRITPSATVRENNRFMVPPRERSMRRGVGGQRKIA